MGRKRVLIVAGDPSGDLHAAGLICAMRQSRPDVEIFAAGGRRMREAGATIVASLDHLGVMGFTEVLSKLPSFIGLMWKLKQFMKQTKPQLVIAVDFPGFNLRLCKEAKRLGLPVMYYIAPQVWAWGEGRVSLMARIVDRMAVVFRFEVPFFSSRGMTVEFVGHPLLERVPALGERGEVRKALGMDGEKPVLALLPGSRTQEVRRLLPCMLESARLVAEKGDVEIAIGAAESVPAGEVERVARRLSLPVRIVRGATAELLHVSRAAIVASGSATLEAAILGTPMVIVYRVSPLSWAIARRVVSIDSIGLVNIVAGKRIVSEHLQHGIDPVEISNEIRDLMVDGEKRSEVVRNLGLVRDSLGELGASQRAAAMALDMLGA